MDAPHDIPGTSAKPWGFRRDRVLVAGIAACQGVTWMFAVRAYVDRPGPLKLALLVLVSVALMVAMGVAVRALLRGPRRPKAPEPAVRRLSGIGVRFSRR